MKALLVVENNRLVSIVTVYDLLESSARLFEEESELQGQRLVAEKVRIK